MPHTRNRFTTNGTRATESHSLTVDRGTLTSATISSSDPSGEGAILFGYLNLRHSASAEHPVIASLASGYVGTDNPIAWTGTITLEPDMEVTATTITDDVIACDLSITVDQP